MQFRITQDPRWCHMLSHWAQEKYSPSFTNADKILFNLSKLGDLGCEEWQANVDLISAAIKPVKLEGIIDIKVTYIKILDLQLLLFLTITLQGKASYECSFFLSSTLHLCAIHSVKKIIERRFNYPIPKFSLVETGCSSNPSFLFECAHRQSNESDIEDEESLDEEDKGCENHEIDGLYHSPAC